MQTILDIDLNFDKDEMGIFSEILTALWGISVA